jgi:hypothetical protein
MAKEFEETIATSTANLWESLEKQPAVIWGSDDADSKNKI